MENNFWKLSSALALSVEGGARICTNIHVGGCVTKTRETSMEHFIEMLRDDSAKRKQGTIDLYTGKAGMMECNNHMHNTIPTSVFIGLHMFLYCMPSCPI